jgi:hypothetical protein
MVRSWVSWLSSGPLHKCLSVSPYLVAMVKSRHESPCAAWTLESSIRNLRAVVSWICPPGPITNGWPSEHDSTSLSQHNFTTAPIYPMSIVRSRRVAPDERRRCDRQNWKWDLDIMEQRGFTSAALIMRVLEKAQLPLTLQCRSHSFFLAEPWPTLRKVVSGWTSILNARESISPSMHSSGPRAQTFLLTSPNWSLACHLLGNS